MTAAQMAALEKYANQLVDIGQALLGVIDELRATSPPTTPPNDAPAPPKPVDVAAIKADIKTWRMAMGMSFDEAKRVMSKLVPNKLHVDFSDEDWALVHGHFQQLFSQR